MNFGAGAAQWEQVWCSEVGADAARWEQAQRDLVKNNIVKSFFFSKRLSEPVQRGLRSAQVQRGSEQVQRGFGAGAAF